MLAPLRNGFGVLALHGYCRALAGELRFLGAGAARDPVGRFLRRGELLRRGGLLGLLLGHARRRSRNLLFEASCLSSQLLRDCLTQLRFALGTFFFPLQARYLASEFLRAPFAALELLGETVRVLRALLLRLGSACEASPAVRDLSVAAVEFGEGVASLPAPRP